MSSTPPDYEPQPMDLEEANDDSHSVQSEQQQESPNEFEASQFSLDSYHGDSSVLDALEQFDWEDFEARYEQALSKANDEEKKILEEAESLSKYFAAWAAAAAQHDDERARKRLQTRQRFVGLSEEKLGHKQQHYVEVVRAFESALALLKST